MIHSPFDLWTLHRGPYREALRIYSNAINSTEAQALAYSLVLTPGLCCDDVKHVMPISYIRGNSASLTRLMGQRMTELLLGQRADIAPGFFRSRDYYWAAAYVGILPPEDEALWNDIDQLAVTVGVKATDFGATHLFNLPDLCAALNHPWWRCRCQNQP
jgi:hypothetical protein